MKKRFNINDYHGDYVMCCSTLNEAITFCRYLDSYGRTWSSRQRYVRVPIFLEDEDGIAFWFNEGSKSSVAYAHRSTAITLEFSNFEWDMYEYKESSVSLDEILGIES